VLLQQETEVPDENTCRNTFLTREKIITTQLQGALIRMLDSDFSTVVKMLEKSFKDGYRPVNKKKL
jgi:hypothetical protein